MALLEDVSTRFFELSSDLLCIAGTDGYLRQVNPSFTQLLGYEPQELTRRSFLELVHLDDRNATKRLVRDIARGSEVMDLTNRLLCKDGEYRWLEWRVVPSEDGKLVCAAARDVTQRRHEDALLRKRQEWMGLLYEVTAQTSRDVDEQLKTALKLTTELLGLEIGIVSRIEGDTYTVEECWAPATPLVPGATFDLGQTYCSITRSEKECVAIDRMGISRHRRHPCYEAFRLESYIGTAVRVHGRVYGTINVSAAAPRTVPFEDLDCEYLDLLAVWVGSALERKQAEQMIAEGSERLELALRGADLGLWDWNVETGQVVFNDRWAEMLGYRPEEIEPHVSSWEKLVHPEDMPRIEKALQAHMDGRTDSYEAEHRMRSKSGDWVWILDRGKIFERGHNGEPLRAAGTHLDISEQKELLDKLAERGAELAAANRDLERRADEIRSMYHTLCHELKTPLTSVREFVSIVHDGIAGEVSPEQAEYLENALGGCDDLARHMNDLVDVSRIDTGKLACEIKAAELGTLLEKVLTVSEKSAAEVGVALTLQKPPESTLAMIDEQRIRQVVTNLVSNALKFTPSGGSVTLGLEPDRDHAFWRISVTDTGRGIEPDKSSRIFDRLYQIRESDWATAGGMGLGLHLCREIVRLHGGSIHVESEPSRGSRFFFTVPVA